MDVYVPRIDVHPDSYELLKSYFKEPEPSLLDIPPIFGIPVYEKDFIPLGKAILTTEDGMTVVELERGLDD